MPLCFLDSNEIRRLLEVINADAEFRLASRYFSKEILLVVGETGCIVKIRDGVVGEIRLNPLHGGIGNTG
jgi:hypothetical protein